MHPTLFQIGSFSIPTYGVAFAGSLALGIILAYRRARVEGINEDHFLMAVFLAVLGIVIGSKVAHIFTRWDWYLDEPMRLLNFRRGHVFYGGYIGGLTFPLLYIHFVAKESILKIIDIWMTYTGLGLAVHRAIGCWGAGCCYGRPTTMPWGITYPPDAAASRYYGHVAVHPTPYYEALLALTIFFTVLWWRKHKRQVYGELLAVEMILYAVGRFVIEFFRGDKIRGIYGPLSTSQWVSIAMVGIFAALVFYIVRQRRLIKEGKKKPLPPGGVPA